MGKLAERIAERAAITKWYDDEKRRIHAEYIAALKDMDTEKRRRKRVLAIAHRASWNKALAIVDAEE